MIINKVSRIRVFLQRPGITQQLLADVAKVHRNRLNGVDTPNWSPSERTVTAIDSAVEKLESLLT